MFSHTYYTAEFRERGIRVVSNQRGYALPWSKETEFDARSIKLCRQGPISATLKILEPGPVAMFESGQLDSAVMFEDITGSNFDIESWVQQMSQANGWD